MVEKFAPDGTDLGVLANVIRPTGLVFDAAGDLCVANFENTIERFSSTGSPLASFTSLSLNNPEGLAFDSLGNLSVANNASWRRRDRSRVGGSLQPALMPPGWRAFYASRAVSCTF
jgi:hypothetical protein